MRHAGAWLAGGFLALLGAGVIFTPTATAADVGYAEDFALAKDRAAALAQLIPGTEDYYYYHALHRLNTGQFDKIDELIRPWGERLGGSARLNEILLRRALLNFDKDPKGSLEYVRSRLDLHFNHQKETVGVAPNLPTALDPKVIARDTLRAGVFVHSGLEYFEDSALEWLPTTQDFSPAHRRSFLQRVRRPDYPNLPKMIDTDFRTKDAVPFGNYPIHTLLTTAQLDELAKLNPGVLNSLAFVRAYAAKLQPGADDDWKRDTKQTAAYLERLKAFADRLEPVHNAFKAHVLFHRLAFDRAQGVYDHARFVEYIKLPRHQPYMAQAWSNRQESRSWPADLNADYTQWTLLPRVGSDEALVRSYLKEFFLKSDSPKEYEPFINDVFLRHAFAETKIENNIGDPETWASQLPPELFRQLKDRIDIDFAFTNKTDFAADEAVSLDLFVKNVPTLLVKVFEVNAKTMYQTSMREVDTDINLDGLVANTEKSHAYADAPLRRVARKFEFPELKKSGVYVVDFIGGGKSSRALIRKGKLHALTTNGTAGQTVTVVDDKNKMVTGASVWLAGVEYAADKNGVITVPYTAQPGRRPVVISSGDFSSLDFIAHQPETYSLSAGIHIDRESLLTQRVAQVLVRPGLFLNGVPVSVKLLEDVRLRITSTDLDNIPTSIEVPEFKLFEDRESVHEFRVPSRLTRLQVNLTAKVKNLSANTKVDLAAGESFVLNEIDRTDRIEDLHFARFGGEYVVELLGRTGEPKPDRAINLAFKHRDFKQLVSVTLKTNAAGRVALGELADITAVRATGPEGTSHVWKLAEDRHTYRQVVHARAGEVVTLPYVGAGAKASRDELALFEMVGSHFRADRFDALAVADGMLELRGLAAGDYDLFLKRGGERVRVRVVAGDATAGYALGALRHLQLPQLKPVQIAEVKPEGESLRIRLKDASPFTRVHVFATRYLPAFNAFDSLAKVQDRELDGAFPGRADSVYLTGRNIGDEYRYVLDRRAMKKFPGNMLERPQMLLNPWAIRSTETGEQLATGGDDFAPKKMMDPGRPLASPAPKPAMDSPLMGGSGGAAPMSTNLDFLGDASAVIPNLVPDKDGVISVARKDVGPHSTVTVVAVDPLNTTVRTVSLPESQATFADLRLKHGLDPTAHFAQQKQVTVLEPGKAFVLADVAGSRFESYDSLAKVYGLYATLSKNAALAEFSFLPNWPTLKPEEKRSLYSKHACHELNFFVFKKDPAFFAEVVKPFLANKKDKTFLDNWLLGNDTTPYLQPWEYGRLNTVERVLMGQRLTGEGPKAARHLDDMLRLLPPQTDRLAVLFDTAVKGGEMSALDEVGEVKLRARLMDAAQKRGAMSNAEAVRPGIPSAATPAAPPVPTSGAGAPPRGQMGGAGGFGAAKGAPAAKRDGRTSGANKDTAGDADKRLPDDANAMKGFKFEDGGELAFREQERFGKEVRQLYRKLDPTKEWAENNYYNLPIRQQVAELISVGHFWHDYAKHADGPFLSRHFADASRNFTEMAFALSVLDLPFTAGKHDTKFDGGKMTLTPGSRVIAFHEEVRAAEGKGGQTPILISQNFYRHGDRFTDVNGEKHDKFVSGEFVVHTPYGCQIVVTNPTSSRQKLNVLVQLPVGSLPLANGQFTKSVALDLEPYRTHTLDYLFYFPTPGQFAHFPVHVSKSEQHLASAPATTFNVVATPTKKDTTSWDYVSQHGSTEEVLAFLNRENVRALNLEKIAFRMKERPFFEATTRLLQDRHLYHPTLWSYGIFHADTTTARQFLAHADVLVNECGGPIFSPLLAIDPVARHSYEHLEYKPLVNARTHALGNRRQIVNAAVHRQYHRLMHNLCYARELTDADLLTVTYYLLLQDRIDEALTTFARVNPDAVTTKLQYDYCAAYMAMFGENPQKARSIASKHAGHPVDRWRNTFTAILGQLDEIEGRGPRVPDIDDVTQRQAALAATEPSIEFTVGGGNINLTWANVETVRVNYYLMDVELLFSRNPFVKASGGQFASIKPNATADMKLPAGRNKLAIPLPDELAKRNVLVEISAAGKTRSQASFANAMDVKVTENFGALRVTDAIDNKPLSKVYVKVYAKLADGSVKFHKDGYTDLRGRFDYASVNTPERRAIERFSVLVLSDDKGALIREAAPPQQ
jgi:hypothetical protein